MTDEANGWSYDEAEYQVRVTVTNNEQGQLVANVEYPDGNPHFINVYKKKEEEKEVKVILRAKKSSVGAMLEAGQFEFGLYDETGKLVSSVVNEQDGNITFPDLTFKITGCFNFTIKEFPLAKEWHSEQTEFPVQVNISDETGTLVADVEYLQGAPYFVNVYQEKHRPPCCKIRNPYQYCQCHHPKVITCQRCCTNVNISKQCWNKNHTCYNKCWCETYIKC